MNEDKRASGNHPTEDGLLSPEQLDQAAGGMINVRKAVASTVKGGALNGTRSGGDDDLDDLEVER